MKKENKTKEKKNRHKGYIHFETIQIKKKNSKQNLKQYFWKPDSILKLSNSSKGHAPKQKSPLKLSQLPEKIEMEYYI